MVLFLTPGTRFMMNDYSDICELFKNIRTIFPPTVRLLGFDLSRVLDICFPGPKVIGLLVHVQYKEEVISLLSTAKVPLVDGFDPLDPVNLADPELQHLSLADKANECAELQFTRCSRALSRLGAGRAHLVGPIDSVFPSPFLFCFSWS
ncbi:hypothetical protein G6F27_013382 [Rhizopus arrhizus]|nr:hypothetical protein G6F27_013382 [Rhizopus arrhizus]